MPSLLDLLGETWPARMAKSAYEAVKLPGDVYAGRVDPLSDEGIGRAADLGGLVMGGSYASAPRGAMGAGPVKPIRAYHGSPHDFDRFDLSKIGTGEGAQAYGHGLYFAENPATAQSYRDALAPGFVRTLNDTPIMDLPQSHRTVAQWMMSTGAKPAEIAPIAEQRAAQALKDADPSELGRMVAENYAREQSAIAAAARELAQGPAKLGSRSHGRMYEVNINADPAQFLDWDKPLAAQPGAHEALLNAARNPAAERLREQQWRQPAWVGGAPNETRYADAISAGTKYTALGGDVGSPARLSAALNEQGIPGIKYLDQGSRPGNNNSAAGNAAQDIVKFFGGDRVEAAKQFENRISGRKSARQGEDIPFRHDRPNDPHEVLRLLQSGEPLQSMSSNYVLFRDDIIDIVKKYGLAGAAAMYGISQDEAKAAMDNPKDKKMSIGRQTYGDEE